MWRIRELLAQGDVDAVNEEIARFRARDTGPVHPLEASYAFNVAAMMALLAGDFETAEQLGQRALQVAEGHNELALSFYGALMMWTWWQRGDLGRARRRLPGGAGPGARRVPDRVGGAGAGPRRGGRRRRPRCASCDVAGGPRLGERGGRPDRGRVAGHGRGGLQRARRAGERLRGAPVRGDAALRGHRRRGPGPGRGVHGAGRPLPRAAGRDHGRPGAGRGAPRGGAAAGPPHGLTALRGRGRSGARPDAAPAPPGRRRGARGRAAAQRGGVGAAPWGCTGWRSWPPRPTDPAQPARPCLRRARSGPRSACSS